MRISGRKVAGMQQKRRGWFLEKFNLSEKKLHEDPGEQAAENGPGPRASVGWTSREYMTTIERWNLRRQVAAAAGMKESVSLSLSLEVNDLEVEEALSNVVHASLGRRNVNRKMV